MLSFLLLSVLGVINLNKITVDQSFDSLQIQNDPQKKYYNRLIENFGSDNIASIYIKDNKIFTSEKLHIIQDLIWDIQELTEVEKVNSLFTSSNFSNVNNTLESTPIFEDISKFDSKNLQKLKFASKNPFLNKQLFNKNDHSMIISLKLKSNISMTSFYEKLDQLLKLKLKNNFTKYTQLGDPSIEHYTNNEMSHAITLLLPLVLLFIFIINTFFTMNFHSSLINLSCFVINIFTTLSFMNFFDLKVYFMTSIIPAIIFVLNSTEITHLTIEYMTINKENHPDKIKHLFNEIGGALFLTSISTFIGFFSMISTDIIMLKNFAIITSFSLFIGYLITLSFFMIYTSYFDFKQNNNSKKKDNQNKYIKSISNFISNTYITYQKKQFVIFSFLAIVITSSLFFNNIKTENGAIELISNKTNLKSSFNLVSKNYKGLNTLNLYYESKNDLRTPKVLKNIFDLEKNITNIDGVNSVNSFAKVIALVNREMANVSLSIPKNKKSIYQYLLSVGPDDISSFVSSDFKKGNIIIYHRFTSSHDISKLIKNINSLLLQTNELSDYSVTGSNVLTLHATDKIVKTMFNSFSLTILLIVVLLSLVFKNIKMGLISIPSNLLPLVLMVIFMAVFKIPLNIGTAIVCSVTLGLAVDDTIHLFYRYSKELKTSAQNPHQATQKTIEKELLPIITTSFSLIAGFSFLTYSGFIPFIHFGLFAGVMLLLAMVADLFLTPFIIGFLGANTFNSLSNPFLFFTSGNVDFSNTTFNGDDLKFLYKNYSIKYVESGVCSINDYKNYHSLFVLENEIGIEKSSQRKKEMGKETPNINILKIQPLSLFEIPIDNRELFIRCSKRVLIVLLTENDMQTIKEKRPSLFFSLYDNNITL